MFLGVFDTQLFLILVNGTANSPVWLKSLVIFFAKRGDIVFIIFLVTLSIFYVFQEADPRHGHLVHFLRSLGYSLFVSVASLLNVTALKNALQIPRPFETLGFSPLISVSAYSFPSGHAATFLCMALVSGWYMPKYRMFFLLFAVCIAFSRILVGVHTPLDILAGWFVGASFAFLAHIHLELVDWIEQGYNSVPKL